VVTGRSFFDLGIRLKFDPYTPAVSMLSFKPQAYTIRGTTETPDYVCFHTADLRQHPQA